MCPLNVQGWSSGLQIPWALPGPAPQPGRELAQAGIGKKPHQKKKKMMIIKQKEKEKRLFPHPRPQIYYGCLTFSNPSPELLKFFPVARLAGALCPLIWGQLT